MVAFAFDTENTGGAAGRKGESGAVIAKLKFRLRKMGRLPASAALDTTGDSE